MVEYRAAGLDAAYSALAHPVRRDILARLRKGQARVTDLAEPFDLSLAAVSKHIRVLEDANLVQRSVRGREHRLRLNARPLMEASTWLEGYRRFWEERLDALEALLTEKAQR